MPLYDARVGSLCTRRAGRVEAGAAFRSMNVSDLFDFSRGQAAVLTGSEGGIELKWAHAFAVKGGDLVVEVAEHAFDLMVTAFMQGQARLV